MSSKFQSKFAQFMIIGIFGVLILSFALTGFQSNVSFIGGGAPSVAKVDGNLVTVREYRNALKQQIEFYSKMMGGKELSTKEIESFKIKETVLKRLVDRKLMENLANDSGFIASEKELKEEIKKLPYFLTNGEFDVNLYKNLLRANAFTPQQFEENMEKDLKVQKLDNVLSSIKLISKNFAQDIAKFKNDTTTLNIVEFSKESLRSEISISASEVNTYLKDEKNVATLKSNFDRNKYKYNKPEEVKARHILLKVDGKDEKAVLAEANKIRSTLNVKNFAEVAKKKSEGPTAPKGGDLGFFGKGRMVKEFEEVAFKLAKNEISQPVKTQFGYHIIMVEDKKKAIVKTFDDVKIELAKDELRKNKDQALDELFNKTIADIEAKLVANNTKAIEKIQKNLGIQFMKDQKTNVIDKRAGRSTLSDDEYAKITAAENKGKVVNLGTAQMAKLVFVVGQSKTKVEDKDIDSTLKSEVSQSSRELRDSLTSELEASASVKTYPEIL